jgi:hypothetical protein
LLHGLVRVQIAVAQIPVLEVDDLDLAALLTLLKVGHGRPQGVPGILPTEGLGRDPKALLIPFQASLEEGHESLGQVVTVLVELAEVRSP